MEVKSNKDKNNEIQTGYIILVAVLFVLFIASVPYFITSKNDTLQIHFDFVTAFFSGLAFVGVLLTLILQKKELDATRKVMDEQSKTMELQRFETTFFNLLDNFNKIRRELSFENVEYPINPSVNLPIPTNELSFFDAVYNYIEIWYFHFLQTELKCELVSATFIAHKKEILEQLNKQHDAMEISKIIFSRVMMRLNDSHEFDFGHYLIVLENFIKFILDNREVINNKENFYFDLIVLSFSKYEVAFLVFKTIYHYKIINDNRDGIKYGFLYESLNKFKFQTIFDRNLIMDPNLFLFLEDWSTSPSDTASRL